MRRHDQLHAIYDNIEERGARLREPIAYRRIEVVSMLHALRMEANRLGQSSEITLISTLV